MPETGQQRTTWQFGVFELDPHARELRKRGVLLKLQDQPLHILTLLLERPGEIVSREEIQKRLWPENTHVDFGNAINSAVRKLRDVLGDDAANPRFIETLARRGYRFIAPVSRPAPASHSPDASEDRTQSAVPSGIAHNGPRTACALLTRFRGAIPVAIATVITAGTILLWTTRNKDTQAPAAPAPFTSYPGFQLFPSFAPEGTRVAFSWGEPGKRPSSIYVKAIGPGEPVRLTNNPNGDFSPAWSPDGRLIAFLRAVDGGHAAVMAIPALGGPERELTRIEFHTLQEMYLADWEWGLPPPFLAWSPDSKWLLAVDHGRVVRVSAESGEKLVITSPPPTIFGDGSLAISPDGRQLAFTRTITYSVSDVYVLPVSSDLIPTGEPQRVTFNSKQITGLAWTPDGRSLLFPSTRGGRLEMWRTKAEPSSKPVKFPITGDDPFDPAFSRQKPRIVYSHKFGYENIWRVSLQGEQAGKAMDLLPSTREEGHPRYSPDGKRIAFEASYSGSEEIWVANADGTNPVQLTSFGAWAGSPRWSPDTQKIAFDCNVAGNWDIYVIDSHGGRAIRLTTNPSLDARPSWSHDGKWIYFGSNRTGKDQVWRIPASGGPETQVTKDDGGVPFESWDGQVLYYNSKLGIQGMRLDDRETFTLSFSIYKDNFALAKRGIYFIDKNDVRLKLFSFERHVIRDIAPVPGPVGDEMSVSPDEQCVTYERYGYAGSELMLVENVR